MKLKSCVFGSSSMLLTSLGAYAACPPGTSPSTAGGKEQCIPNAGVVVVIDPDWLVANFVLLALLLVVAVYIAVKVSGITEKLNSKSFGG